MNLDDFLREAARKEMFRTGQGATFDQIGAIQERLQVVLPDTYRSLLARVGHVRWFGGSIFGVSSDDEEHDTIARTSKERQFVEDLFEEDRPMSWRGNVIAEIFGGGFCVLHSKDSDRAGQISAHAPEERFAEVQYWLAIEDYFDYLVSGIVNYRAVSA